MKIRFLHSVICAFVLCFLLTAPVRAAVDKRAELVVDVETGRVLHDYKSGHIRHPASLTKMMTVYMIFNALERGKLTPDTLITVSKNAARQECMCLRVRPGSKISVRDIVYSLVTVSANDMATLIGEKLAGSERKFAKMMTRKARALGMKNTVFINASGLPDRRQVTTARDMVILGLRLMKDFPEYYKIFKTQTYSFKKGKMKSHNRLLKTYKGADGMKTGYIRMSGFNLVTSAERDGKRLIAAVFGGKTGRKRDARMKVILDQSWKKIDQKVKKAQFLPVSIVNLAALKVGGNPLYRTGRETILIADRGAGGSGSALKAVKKDIVAKSAPVSPSASTVKIAKKPKANPSPDIPGLIRQSEVKNNLQFAGMDADLVLKQSQAAKKAAAKGGGGYIAVNDAKNGKVFVSGTPTGSVTNDPVSQIILKENALRNAAARAGKNVIIADRDWAVQVGAFSKEESAKSYLYGLVIKYEDYFGQSNPEIVRIQKGKERIYRARFAGFTPSAAKKICADLKKQRRKCVPVSVRNI